MEIAGSEIWQGHNARWVGQRQCLNYNGQRWWEGYGMNMKNDFGQVHAYIKVNVKSCYINIFSDMTIEGEGWAIRTGISN